MKKGEKIPSSCFNIEFISTESFSDEIELDFRRSRIKHKGEKFLLYGRDGDPYMKESENLIFYEPLSESPIYLSSNQKINIWITEKGNLVLKEETTEKIHNLGSIL